VPQNYAVFLAELKQRIRTARLKAALAVNQELVLLYWAIGRDILYLLDAVKSPSEREWYARQGDTEWLEPERPPSCRRRHGSKGHVAGS
jgi:hypothetical protein